MNPAVIREQSDGLPRLARVLADAKTSNKGLTANRAFARAGVAPVQMWRTLETCDHAHGRVLHRWWRQNGIRFWRRVR